MIDFTHTKNLNGQKCRIIREQDRGDLIAAGVTFASKEVLIENEDGTKEIVFPWEITEIRAIKTTQSVADVLKPGLKAQSDVQRKIKAHCRRLGLEFRVYDHDQYSKHDCSVFKEGTQCKIEIENYQKKVWFLDSIYTLWDRVHVPSRRRKNAVDQADIWLKSFPGAPFYIAVDLNWLFNKSGYELEFSGKNAIKRDWVEGDDTDNCWFYKIAWEDFRNEDIPAIISDKAKPLFDMIETVHDRKTKITN